MNSQGEESIAPYYRRHWNRKHGFVYNPPDKSTGRLAVTRGRDLRLFARAISTGYYQHASVPTSARLQFDLDGAARSDGVSSRLTIFRSGYSCKTGSTSR